MSPEENCPNLLGNALGAHCLGTVGGDPLKTYILRLYRFEKDRPRGLVGVVEEVGVKGKMAFTNFDELWDILNPSRAQQTRKRAGKKGQGRKEVTTGPGFEQVNQFRIKKVS